MHKTLKFILSGLCHRMTRLSYNCDNIQKLRDQGYSWPKVDDYYGKTYPASMRYHKRNKNNNKSTTPTPTEQVAQELVFEPEDTRPWTIKQWNEFFLKKYPLVHQIENQQHIRSGIHLILNDPRQTGKTVYSIEPGLTRELSESGLYDYDRPWMYITHNIKKARKMLMTIRYHLLTNRRIRKFYGDLVDLSREQGLSLIQNTANELNLKTLKDKELISLQVLSINSNVRGESTYGCIIDDAIDIKELRDKRESIEKVTEEFMIWFKTKILPLVKGPIFIIGTRYGVNDLYQQCKEMRIFRYISRRSLDGTIPSYTIPEIEYNEENEEIPLRPQDIVCETNIESQLLAPQLYETMETNPRRSGTITQNFLLNMWLMGDIIFQQEMQNNPINLTNDLDWSWLNIFTHLPITPHPNDIKWVIMADVGAGETKKADHTAMSLVGEYQHYYYIYDVVFGHWTGKQKFEQLEKFVLLSCENLAINPPDIKILIETVLSQRDFFQRVRDELSPINKMKFTPIPIEPKGRGVKNDRIRYGLGQEMENGKVLLNQYCRSKNQLKLEIDGFPSVHPDIIDAIDQAIFFYKSKYQMSTGIRMAF